MKCFLVLVSVIAACNAANLRVRRNPHAHTTTPEPQRYRLSASNYKREPFSSKCTPAPLPERETIILQQELPAPFVINYGAKPKVIEHESKQTEIDYYEKPTVINHEKEAIIKIYPLNPVIFDSFGAPTVHEKPGPNTITIQEVGAAAGAGGAGGSGGSGGAGGAGGSGGAEGAGGAGGAGSGGSEGACECPADKPGHLEPVTAKPTTAPPCPCPC